MTQEIEVKLDKYLSVKKISTEEFARRTKHSYSAVSKWRQRIRVPRLHTKLKIKSITKGKVTEHDWTY